MISIDFPDVSTSSTISPVHTFPGQRCPADRRRLQPPAAALASRPAPGGAALRAPGAAAGPAEPSHGRGLLPQAAATAGGRLRESSDSERPAVGASPL